jgi:hypothetical protein
VKDPDLVDVDGLQNAVERGHVVAGRMAGLAEVETDGIDLYLVVVPFTTTIECFTGIAVEGKEAKREKVAIQQCAVSLEGLDYAKVGVSRSWTGEYWEGVDKAVQSVLDGYLIGREAGSPDASKM